MKIQFIALGGIGLLIAGCVTVTPPVPMGGGRYMLTLNARGGFKSNGALLAESIQRANAFCAANGQTANVINTQTSGVQMWTPQDNQIVFECVSPPH